MMLDAGDVVLKDLSREELTRFYYFVAENTDHPRVPKSTEEILADFDALFELSKTHS
jgi:hypothetical protein